MAVTRGTAAWACDAVESYIGGNVVAGVALPHVQAGYEDFLRGMDPRDDHPKHDWSFLSTPAEVTVGASAKSTGTGVYAVGPPAIITLTTTTNIFDAGMAGRYVTVEDYGTYRISGFLAANSVTVAVDAGQSAASFATAKNVWLEGIYDMPADFGYLIRPFGYMYVSSDLVGDLEETTPEEIRRMWRDDNEPANPTHYAIVPQQFSTATGQRWLLMVAPRTLTTHVWQYRYFRVAVDLTDAAVYFLGGQMHYETIKMGSLADRELLVGGKYGPLKGKYDQMMVGSIEYDQLLISRMPLNVGGESTGLER